MLWRGRAKTITPRHVLEQSHGESGVLDKTVGKINEMLDKDVLKWGAERGTKTLDQ